MSTAWPCSTARSRRPCFPVHGSCHHKRRPCSDLALSALPAALDKEIPDWRHDNNYLRSVYGIDPATIDATPRLGQQRLSRPSAAYRHGARPRRAHSRLRPPRRHLQARHAALPLAGTPRRDSQAHRRTSDLIRRQGPSRRQRRQGADPRGLRRRAKAGTAPRSRSSTSKTTTGISASSSPRASMSGSTRRCAPMRPPAPAG